ncbi:MAG TPA: PhzF family phenazine biosynthesis protein [Steroidobacteraceae bacterium]|nr:PhzF family phenazine biosynthesis protein [Steroidobacteraceae bacterium]
MQPSSYKFALTDVFTDALFGGNQLAVVTDARGLSSAQMQNIAREFNFSETTFVLPPQAVGARHVIRIFTPRAELPFAGHPTIGTAAVLAFQQLAPAADAHGTVIYEEAIGPIAVRVQSARGRTLIAEFEIAAALERGPSPDLSELAHAVGVSPSAVTQAWCAGIGIAFCFVHLTDEHTVDAAVVDRTLWQALVARGCAAPVFLFCGEFTDGATLYARMLAPDLGVAEDPATGSACVALVASLAERGALREGVLGLTIRQGVAMGRPSLLQAYAHRVAGATHHLRLRGSSVIVAEGSLTIGG